jgi:CRP/FNR family cyclic AMP-dependent transcriptional regulator
VLNRKIRAFSNKQGIFVQGDSSDAVFYIHKGKVRLTVVSKSGKEVTIGILNEGDFFGEGCLAGQTLRLFSATAMTDGPHGAVCPASQGIAPRSPPFGASLSMHLISASDV